MCGKRFVSPLAVLAALSILALAAPVKAGSVSAGGWTASWDNAFNDVLGLTVLSPGQLAVNFNKFAQFTNAPSSEGYIEPMVITFQQTSANAFEFVRIDQESVVNQTGVNWTGFNFILAPSAASNLKFDNSLTFKAGDSFSISPFTTHNLSADGKTLALSGGVLPSTPPNNVWTPGQVSGALWIDAAPKAGIFRAFEFKEQPVGVAVPLPAAGLAGLYSLGGLGALKALKKLFV